MTGPAPCPVCGRPLLPGRGEHVELFAKRKTCGSPACRETYRTQQVAARQAARLEEAAASYRDGMSISRLAQAYSVKPDVLRAMLRKAGHNPAPAKAHEPQPCLRRARDDEPPPDYLLEKLLRVYGPRAPHPAELARVEPPWPPSARRPTTAGTRRAA